ncbi:DUF1993 domain-containing protein [Pleomorphomonas sp. NRK KF1]|uniref:DUF1993 domain-containing protein n=1 Tax=Pleomorphomonas sp. NRK KF1 TaxID=2943000 RepID=UPI002044657C|nr:DUF1993 domain-containing protein [Pleomorphomonas sp. NRK KF1]MCM5555742.1 DUF1993 domain-containing protein [Pleomorphomonas sp. NRK KF1]
MIGLYDISVPVFARYLERLDGLVIITAAHAADSDLPEEALLQSRLAPDMLPFEAQVRIAARFSLRALGPLVPRLPDLRFEEAASFAALRDDIAAVFWPLSRLTPDDLDQRDTGIVTDRAGLADIELPAARFIVEYALPNMLFHLTTAYAIARWEGVKLGKADFDGWHRY